MPTLNGINKKKKVWSSLIYYIKKQDDMIENQEKKHRMGTDQ